MCGIFCVMSHKVGKKSGIQKVLEGLKSLEYRGYDSAGVSCIAAQKLHVHKGAGKIDDLRDHLLALPDSPAIMGHTRWATHGRPSEKNAHPFTNGKIAILHNGIIENHLELKSILLEAGYRFETDTDTEVLLHLIDYLHQNDSLENALKKAVAKAAGSYAFCVQTVAMPDRIFAVKQSSPLVLALSDDESYISSDAAAFHEMDRGIKHVFVLDDGAIAVVSSTSFRMVSNTPKPHASELKMAKIAHSNLRTKLKFSHFMQKEIYDQPQSIQRLIDSNDSISPAGLNLGKIDAIQLVACGSAFYAAEVGRHYLENLSKYRVFVDLAHEARSSSRSFGPKTLVIALSQSGETADTLACIEKAKKEGSQTLSFCNNSTSSLSRLTQRSIELHAGPETAVASTKAVTAMMLSLFFFALSVGRNRGTTSRKESEKFIETTKELPSLVNNVLLMEKSIAAIAKQIVDSRFLIFIGRGLHFPIAMESALKFKEISYIPCDGFAGGELKHGPIALLEEGVPVIALAPKDRHYPKMMSNIEEVLARGAKVIGVGHQDDDILRSKCTHFIGLPVLKANELMQPILTNVAMQLFAFQFALSLGRHIDQPRNLAKAVTVE